MRHPFLLGRPALALVLGASLLAARPKPPAAHTAPKEKILALGDQAPALRVSRWIKGTPLKDFRPGEVYVVEFWATWCGPCRAAMPHLTELAKRYAGKATVIGVNVWENAKSPAELNAKLDTFLADMGASMGYSVAQDTAQGFMSKAWMKAGRRDGIPASFLVDQKGRVVWMGHPGALEKNLKQVIAGTFDLGAAIAEARQVELDKAEEQESFKVFESVNPLLEKALAAKDWAGLVRAADQVEAGHPQTPSLKYLLLSHRLLALASTDPAQVRPCLEKLEAKPSERGTQVAINALYKIRGLGRDWSELALSYLDRLADLAPEQGKEVEAMRFPFLMCTDEPRARAMFEGAAADTAARAAMVEAILDEKNASRPWLELALGILEAKAKAPEGKATLAALAQAYARVGRHEDAVKAQEGYLAYGRSQQAPEQWIRTQEAKLAAYKAAIGKAS